MLADFVTPWKQQAQQPAAFAGFQELEVTLSPNTSLSARTCDL